MIPGKRVQVLNKGLERGHIPFSKGKPHNFANPLNIRNGGNLGSSWPIITSNPDLVYISFNGFTEEIENMELTQKHHNDINVGFCYDFLKSLIDPNFNGVIWEESWDNFFEGYTHVICHGLSHESVESKSSIVIICGYDADPVPSRLLNQVGHCFGLIEVIGHRP